MEKILSFYFSFASCKKKNSCWEEWSGEGYKCGFLVFLLAW